MKKELEDKFAQDHPFKPKINKNYQISKKISETEQERYNRLSKPKIFEIISTKYLDTVLAVSISDRSLKIKLVLLHPK